jgi:hypothetical protein
MQKSTGFIHILHTRKSILENWFLKQYYLSKFAQFLE